MSVTLPRATRLLRRTVSGRRLVFLLRHWHAGQRRRRETPDDCRPVTVPIVSGGAGMGGEARQGVVLAQCPWEIRAAA